MVYFKVHGQESATIEYEGEVKIMPFNLNEEFEEGHYDEEGNFVYDKNKDEVYDEWMDNIDWDSVKHKAGDHWNKMACLGLNFKFNTFALE